MLLAEGVVSDLTDCKLDSLPGPLDLHKVNHGSLLLLGESLRGGARLGPLLLARRGLLALLDVLGVLEVPAAAGLRGGVGMFVMVSDALVNAIGASLGGGPQALGRGRQNKKDAPFPAWKT